jgi:hypothetical protein
LSFSDKFLRGCSGIKVLLHLVSSSVTQCHDDEDQIDGTIWQVPVLIGIIMAQSKLFRIIEAELFVSVRNAAVQP